MNSIAQSSSVMTPTAARDLQHGFLRRRLMPPSASTLRKSIQAARSVGAAGRAAPCRGIMRCTGGSTMPAGSALRRSFEPARTRSVHFLLASALVAWDPLRQGSCTETGRRSPSRTGCSSTIITTGTWGGQHLRRRGSCDLAKRRRRARGRGCEEQCSASQPAAERPGRRRRPSARRRRQPWGGQILLRGRGQQRPQWRR
mmetsp:Transcript_20760/g.45659  ORF Transcript_20760/g.45659 Transcript_20760/m.45659 type:complete len:200 (-) Transcript_20760:2343-2942(-)